MSVIRDLLIAPKKDKELKGIAPGIDGIIKKKKTTRRRIIFLSSLILLVLISGTTLLFFVNIHKDKITKCYTQYAGNRETPSLNIQKLHDNPEKNNDTKTIP